MVRGGGGEDDDEEDEEDALELDAALEPADELALDAAALTLDALDVAMLDCVDAAAWAWTDAPPLPPPLSPPQAVTNVAEPRLKSKARRLGVIRVVMKTPPPSS